MRIEPLTGNRLADLAELFETNATTRGCWCAYFLVTNREYQQDWGAGNRARFEQLVAHEIPPGLLAYRDGQPVGWCAMGPRSRYPRALRSIVLKGRDPGEDDRVWLVPCFFVRRTARRTGVTRALLAAAVGYAQRAGALAIEGFPLAGETRRSPGDAYLGLEPVFAACGFTPVSRPTPVRVVMRRSLRGIDRRARLM